MDVKLRRKDGFTLAELLIVVAIITVLVAVSIPIFSAQLDKARAATDAANVRAAKAAAVTDYLTNGTTTESVIYYYDADSGKITTDATVAKGYSKYGKSTDDIDIDNATGKPKGKIVAITVSDSTTTAEWVMGSGSSSTTNPLNGLSATEWKTLTKDAQYGVSVPAGTLISEGTSTYLFYCNSDWYAGDMRNVSLATSYTSGVFTGCVEKVTKDTVVYTENNFLSTFDGKIVPAGTVVNYNSQYLVLASAYTVNENHLPSANHDNWVTIK